MLLPQPIKGSGIGLLAMLAGLSLFSCEKQPEGELSVSGISSAWADPGDTLRVSGACFTKNSRVLLGSEELQLIHSDGSRLEALLPEDASSGMVLVKEGAKELEAGFLKIMDNQWDQVFPAEAHIYFLHFLAADKQIGWAFGHDVTFKTLDGGNTWQLYDSPQPHFEKVIATNANHLVGLASQGIMQSNDGGRSWSSLALPANFSVVDFSFTSERNGYVLGSREGRHEVVITNDAGESWNIGISIDRYFEGNLYTDMADEKIWLIDHHLQMLYEADLPGADNWQEHELPRLIPRWAPVYFNHNGMALIGGSTKDSWFVSVNDGPLWQNQPALLWKTTNGGMSWQKITVPDIVDKPDMEVVEGDGENIWAVGMDMILRSADGGVSWQERYIRWLETDNPHQLYITDQQNAFLLPRYGPLLRYQAALGE